MVRALAIAFVMALAAPASAEDWSKYIDHGEPTPGVAKAAPVKTAEPRAKTTKAPKATPAKSQAKARAKTKARRK